MSSPKSDWIDNMINQAKRAGRFPTQEQLKHIRPSVPHHRINPVGSSYEKTQR